MLKKLDTYILRLFIGPFIAIFSILFFLFIVIFFWVKLNEFISKGLEISIILKVVFYYGCSFIPLIIPVTVLLTSIMVYGSLGEHYELAAIKSTGISLWRAIKPLFILISFMSIGLYFYSDYVVPITQKKLINFIRNIARTQPGLNLKEGSFIENIPNITMKIDKKIGTKGQNFEGVFIKYGTNKDKNQSVIIAEEGSLMPSENPNYLRMKLKKGFLYKENNSQKEEKRNYDEIKFDVLIEHLDISSLINRDLEEEFFNDRSNMLNTNKLVKRIDLIKKNNEQLIKNSQKGTYRIFFNEQINFAKNSEPFTEKNFEELNLEQKKNILKKAHYLIKNFREKIKYDKEIYLEEEKRLAVHKFELYKKLSLAITCILMFIMGSPLGALIRKGGMGLPVIIALFIFITYHILSTIFQNLAEKTLISPWLGAWVSNLIMFPIGILSLYRAILDKPIRIKLFS